MRNLLARWQDLENTRKFLVLGAAAAVILVVAGLLRVASTPSMSLLYAGVDGAQAGRLIQTLEQRGQAYEVRGDAIYVEAHLRDETRMALAAEGLPAMSAAGYELLDGLTGFGTTSQMFDAAYWRAREGELARTIVSSPHIRAARVHISQSAAQPFRREANLSASVTVTPAASALTTTQAQALRYLVASAVGGLQPEDVAIIDTIGGLIPVETAEGAGHGADRAEALRQNVERLLAAHTGPGRSVVEVHVETITDRERIVERRIEPESRIAMSHEAEERTSTSSDSRNGAVTVASNLPDGDAEGSDGRSDSRDQQSRQRTSYDVSQTSREIERGPGSIRRLTVAVMLDEVQAPNENGDLVWTPRPQAEIDALRELVASAVGFDESRGDVITLRSLPFEARAELGTAAGLNWAERWGLDLMSLLKLAILAFVALVLGLFVLRPLLRKPPEVAALPRPIPRSLAGMDGQALGAGDALSGEIDDSDLRPEALRSAERSDQDQIDPVERMRALIAGRQDETLHILRGWMSEQRDGAR